MKNTLPDRVRLGAIEVDLRAGEVRDGNRSVYLQEQPLFVLRMLVERRGEIVTRDEIKKKLWPNDTVVDFDHGINTAIRRLRQALGDSADNPKYLATIARRGYRLLVRVEPIETTAEEPSLSGNRELQQAPASQENKGAANVPQAAPVLIGKKVSHYRVLEIIGGGGMGVVYKAEDLKLGRQVALKFLPEELAWDKAALGRFEREARTASSLDHPNILTIYSVEEDEQQPFIVMQLLEGRTLRDVLAASQGKPLALDQLLDVAIETCDGLQAAHEKGIVHRDIKPANLFLTAAGQVKIVDFGLAKLATVSQEFETDNLLVEVGATGGAAARRATDVTVSRAGVTMGTAGYMSPEQVRGEKVDARTDIFSFGLVLYEMATGQRAFTGDTAAHVQDAIVNRTPVPVRQLNPGISPQLETIIEKALEKDRGQRYLTAAELGSELERLKAKADSGRAMARRRRYSVWLAASLITLLVALAVAPRLWRAAEPPRLPNLLTERQLTANPQGDYVTGAAISPDGKSVAYQDQTGLYLRTLESGETHPVALPAELRGRIFGLHWFPGGGKLLATVAGSSGSWDIWVITVRDDIEPSLLPKLMAAAEPQLLYRRGMESAISPDGRKIAFTRWEVGELAHEVWVGAIDGKAPRKLVGVVETEYVFSPVWSPDGQWIAYGRIWKTAAGSYSSAIEVRPADGGPAKTLLAESSLPKSNTLMFGGAYWFNESWSSDWRLLFSVTGGSESHTKYSLWEVKVDSRTTEAAGRPERLTQWSDLAPRNQTITLDGKHVLFIKERLWMDVYLGELSSGGSNLKVPRRLTLDDRGSDASAWSHDSRAILFDSERSGQSAIFKQDLNENVAKTVVTGSGDVSAGKESPGGAWILYAESAGESSDSYRLMRRASGGGSPATLVDEFDYGRADNFWCSSNPKASTPCVLGLREGKDIVFYSLDPIGGKGRRLGKIEVIGKYMGWAISPDGSRLALVDRDKYGKRIEILTLADGGWQEIPLEPGTGNLQSIAWAADGKSFFATAWTPDSYDLLHVTLAGKVKLLLHNGRNRWLHNPLPSPDGKYLAFSSETWDGNVWMIDNF